MPLPRPLPLQRLRRRANKTQPAKEFDGAPLNWRAICVLRASKTKNFRRFGSPDTGANDFEQSNIFRVLTLKIFSTIDIANRYLRSARKAHQVLFLVCSDLRSGKERHIVSSPQWPGTNQ
jgi:hypothetical protein